MLAIGKIPGKLPVFIALLLIAIFIFLEWNADNRSGLGSPGDISNAGLAAISELPITLRPMSAGTCREAKEKRIVRCVLNKEWHQLRFEELCEAGWIAGESDLSAIKNATSLKMKRDSIDLSIGKLVKRKEVEILLSYQ